MEKRKEDTIEETHPDFGNGHSAPRRFSSLRNSYEFTPARILKKGL
jgi:hypothetical protein